MSKNDLDKMIQWVSLLSGIAGLYSFVWFMATDHAAVVSLIEQQKELKAKHDELVERVYAIEGDHRIIQEKISKIQ